MPDKLRQSGVPEDATVENKELRAHRAVIAREVQHFGTGTFVPVRACMTRNSRSTTWANFNNFPVGSARSTYFVVPELSKYVGLD